MIHTSIHSALGTVPWHGMKYLFMFGKIFSKYFSQIYKLITKNTKFVCQMILYLCAVT